MLIPRGLRTLLLGLLTVNAAVLLPIDTQVQISRGERKVRDASRHDAPRAPETTTWTPTSSKWRRLRSRQEVAAELSCPQSKSSALSCPPNSTCCPLRNGGFECCMAGWACCLKEDGSTGCCPVDCDDGGCPLSSAAAPTSISTISVAADASTVFVTQTLTSTVTIFTGSPTTGLVTTTNTIFITLQNPTERTQTATVTATSFFQPAKRSVAIVTALPSEAEDVTQSELVAAYRLTRVAKGLRRRQGQTITSTVTSEVFTTVFRPSTVLGTITNTVFSTKYVAPNAVTTVFVTTTVFLPSGAIPTTPAPTAVPTVPGPSAPVTLTTTAATSSVSSSGASSLPSTLPSSTTPPPESTMMMETMMRSSLPPTSTTSPTPTPSMTPMTVTAPAFTTTQIIGIAIGSLLGLILLILLAFGLRRVVRRRRAAQAQMRQQLTPPEDGPAMTMAAPRRGPPSGGGLGALATNGSGTSSSAASGPSNHSMLTGEGEVRIVIRPAPKRRTQSSQLWPMPPGHRGQTYSLFVEETTTGATTPQDPGEWSIASEQGSVKDGREGSNDNNNNTTVYSTGDAYGEPRASGSGGRPSTSIFSAGWDRETSFGARSEGSSYPGMGTLLTPPPAWHGHSTEGRWPRDPADYEGNERGGSSRGNVQRQSSGYQMGSLGIGKAW